MHLGASDVAELLKPLKLSVNLALGDRPEVGDRSLHDLGQLIPRRRLACEQAEDSVGGGRQQAGHAAEYSRKWTRPVWTTNVGQPDVMKAPPHAAQAVAAWIAGLVAATSLPAIFWQEALHQRASAMPFLVGAAASGLLLLGSYLAPSLRALRLFAAVLLVQGTGFAAIGLVGGLPAYRAWALQVPAALSFGVANSAKLVPVALAAALLAASGRTRGELYLRLGDLRAPAEIPLPVTTRSTTWPPLRIIVVPLGGAH